MRTHAEARAEAAAILAQLSERQGVALAFYAGQHGVPESEDHIDVWVFNWNSATYQRTGNIRNQILMGPIAVPKDDRPAVILGTAGTTAEELDRWRSGAKRR
ncbi:YrhB domain-containing protein [Herbiconiux sp. L3-i23]|uniref:YrhB domain-containing protein n=1 Tax=Herbiconiux sp. L3-i23 TaxID=2905871 RepID=UPI002054CD37|nr:YrhB domain-containing protein [Herbiconiux sp. L3-i23]BDI21458.1 hypothetical protein L3i23_02340 [Herbiconiux sp. L3-i23]